MRRILTLAVALCVTAFAGDLQAGPYGGAASPDRDARTTTRHAAKAADTPLNNVVRLAADGARIALCCCGAEFTVATDTPALEHDGTRFFMCSAGCRDAVEHASAGETAKSMAAWRAKFAAEPLASNAAVRNGVTSAVCGCGKSFVVAKNTPVVTENGVRLYCCSEACHEHVAKLSAAERLALETKVAATAAPAQAGM